MLLHNRKILAASVGVSLLLALPARAEISIGALMPMTGGLQVYGEACLTGVKLAAKEINQAGGVLGQNLAIKVGDTQTKTQPALDAAKKLVSLEKVVGIVGALGSVMPVAQTIAANDGIPMISWPLPRPDDDLER